ncbi:MAG: polyamine aminopropyltransferase [Planctomycetota bacterium]
MRAVDLDASGDAVFRELSEGWAGEVTLDIRDADAWLRTRRASFDMIVEDLSVPSPVGTVKPYVSLDTLPERIRSRLAPGGVAVTNLLPLPGTDWDALYARVAATHLRVIVVHLDDYENRIVLAGDALPNARETGQRLREALRVLESDLLRQVKLKTLRYS